MLVLLSPFILIFVLALVNPPPREKRTIVVGSEVCEVVFMKTGEKCEDRLLHHECKDVGYDQAVCPEPKAASAAKPPPKDPPPPPKVEPTLDEITAWTRSGEPTFAAWKAKHGGKAPASP